MKVPKDLGIKFGSKEERAYTEQLEQLEMRIMLNKIQIEFDGVAIILAKKRIEEEKAKFK